MPRIFLLQYVLPFLLPTVAYVAWLTAAGRINRSNAGQSLRAIPWSWLLGVGGLLVLVGLIITGLIGEGGTESTYVPAEYEGGRIVPGHFAPGQKP